MISETVSMIDSLKILVHSNTVDFSPILDQKQDYIQKSIWDVRYNFIYFRFYLDVLIFIWFCINFSWRDKGVILILERWRIEPVQKKLLIKAFTNFPYFRRFIANSPDNRLTALYLKTLPI